MSTLTVGTDKQYSSIQAAIDAASEGDTILVYPGTYTETAYYDGDTGNTLGLYIGKSLTIKGVDASGNDITDASATEATVIASSQGSLRTSFAVTADNVTITGLTLQAAANPNEVSGRGINVTGNNFTLQYSAVYPKPGVSGWIDGAITFRDIGTNPTDFVSHITTYKIDGNIISGGIQIANGVGYGHDPADLDMAFTNNTVVDIARDDNAASPWSLFGGGRIDGAIGHDADLAIPVVMPTTVFGNDLSDGAYFYFIDMEQDPADIDIDRAYVESFVANNQLAEYAYALDSDGKLIHESIEWLGKDVWFASLEDRLVGLDTSPGDTVVVSTGGKTLDETIEDDDMTVQVAPGGTLNLTLASGVNTVTLTGSGIANVVGNDSANTIIGNSAANAIDGGQGDDLLTGGGGDDDLTGGAGTDTAVFVGNLTPAALSVVGGGWQVDAGDAGVDTLTGVEIVSHAGGRFLLVDHGGFDTFGAAIAAATLPGDVVAANATPDLADQTFDFSSETVAFSVTTGSGNDTITTGSGDDTISSGAGNDTVNGGAGDDSIAGGGGDDLLTGGTGNDAIDGGEGIDTAVYGGGLAAAALSLVGSGWQVDGGSEGVDTLAGVEIVSHAGGRFLLVGNGGFASIAEAIGAATLPGDVVAYDTTTEGGGQSIALGDMTVPFYVATGSGDDAITTGSGDDTISSGAGKDKVKAGKGNDTVQAGDGNDKVIGNAGDDALHGDAGKDKIKGGNGKDALYGGDGNDKLVGGKGDDTLYGDAGKDKLVGGKGSDTFVFNDLGKKDKVQDFHPGEDKLAFDGDVFTGLGEAGPLEAKYFGFGKHAKTADQKLIYQKSKGVLWYDADGNGGGEAVKVAVLKHAPHLTADDILVI